MRERGREGGSWCACAVRASCVRAARENWVSEWWHWWTVGVGRAAGGLLLASCWSPAGPSCPPLCRKQESRANRGPAHQTSRPALSVSDQNSLSIVSHSSSERGRGLEEAPKKSPGLTFQSLPHIIETDSSVSANFWTSLSYSTIQ